ncbi:hypothetical protein KKG72_12165 [bacterium]|nr:hypothetical protein [bacterium]MBU1993927.1 hypothetical protein [bacterium]
MKPLLAKDLKAFLQRFDNFRDCELRSINVVSPTNITITLAAQDVARGFDWISIEIEYNGVIDSQLLDNSKLSLVDMSDGISIINEDNKFAFGIGERTTLSSIKNSTCQVICSNVKYKEGIF